MSDAPGAEGLTEVLVVFLQTQRRSRVEQPTDAQGAVDQEPTHIAEPICRFTLQELVHNGQRVGEVAEEIRHPGAHECRCDGHIALGHRSQHVRVGRIVELVDAAVDRLQRIQRIVGR